MKTQQFNFKYGVLLVLALLLTSCAEKKADQQSQDNVTLVKNIPDLLDRNEKIRYDKEWDQVQNNYVKFRSNILKDQNDADSKIKLSLIFIQEARVTGEHGHYYPAALQLLDAALNQEKPLTSDQQFLALSTKAGVQLSLHHFSNALITGSEAKKLNGYNAQIYGVLIDAQVELGQYDEAVMLADTMVSIRPDLRSYARVSYLRQIYGDIAGAIEAMKLAVSAGFPPYEETAWARYQLAKLYENNEEYAEAEKQYQQILMDRPDYPFAIAALAHLENLNANTEKAETLYDQAINVIPEVSFYVEKAKLFFKTNREVEGNLIMQEVFTMLEEDQNSGHNMDLYYSEIYSEIMNDQKKALHYALQEYAARPANIDVNKQLAAVYFKMEDYEKAKEHLHLALRTNSKDHALMKLKSSLQIES
jgi:tetratricopeptide (TPR) repeat protein